MCLQYFYHVDVRICNLSFSVVVTFSFYLLTMVSLFFFFFQAEDGIRDLIVTGVQTCALPIYLGERFGRERVLGLAVITDAAYEALRLYEVDGGGDEERLDAHVHQAGDGGGRSEERRVGKSVDLGGRRIIKKKKRSKWGRDKSE